MEDVIKLLPDSVANQIAAGEVIQRPASVVKELVENAVDAGATAIQIVIKDAGRTLIQVIDNGCGMSMTDARMAFERHATSKIRQANDLLTLRTMGFRGEALPSIAAVSDIDLRTMRRDDVTGTRLLISASKVEDQMPEACVPGTNLMVKRLFFNLPARRKFLKKDNIELSHIIREFERLALVNTSIEFTLSHNDVILHKLTPGSLKKRVTELFGKSLEHQLIPIETQTSIVKIDGYVCLPENARKRNALQYFFVNGRYMRHPYFHKAVLKCYEDLISSESQPNYFINFTVDPETIDVNIHPQKYEIKFENEQPVWQILIAAIKEALGRFNASGALDFEAVDVPDIPAFDGQIRPDRPDEDIDPTYNPFAQSFQPTTPEDDWEKLYAGFTRKTPNNNPNSKPSSTGFFAKQSDFVDGQPMSDYNQGHLRGSAMNDTPAPPDIVAGQQVRRVESRMSAMAIEESSLFDEKDTPSSELLQLKGRYIVSAARNGLLVIDQHRAHTLVLYHKYLDLVNKGDIPSQRLIFPETVTLDAAQAVAISEIGSILQSMGFDMGDLGDMTWAINAIPAIIGGASPSEALVNILTAFTEQDDDVVQTQWQKIALAMARSAAIKYGATLSRTEMEHLVADLFRLPAPTYTPDGKTVLANLDIADITRLF